MTTLRRQTMTTWKTNTASALIAGAVAVTMATPSFADDRAWVAAGAGFAAGTLIGAAAANANAAYYGPGFAYAPAYPYGYAPGYAYAPGYVYAPAPAYAYAPVESYAAAPAYPYGYSYNVRRRADDPDPRIGGSARSRLNSDD